MPIWRLMMNSSRARPTPSLGSCANVERLLRVADVHHDLDRRSRGISPSSVSLDARTSSSAVVDEAGVALGAGHRDLAAVRQRRGRVADADHRRDAELARDDRRVAGAAAAVGDDRAARFMTGSQSGSVMSATSTSPG